MSQGAYQSAKRILKQSMPVSFNFKSETVIETVIETSFVFGHD